MVITGTASPWCCSLCGAASLWNSITGVKLSILVLPCLTGAAWPWCCLTGSAWSYCYLMLYDFDAISQRYCMILGLYHCMTLVLSHRGCMTLVPSHRGCLTLVMNDLYIIDVSQVLHDPSDKWPSPYWCVQGDSWPTCRCCFTMESWKTYQCTHDSRGSMTVMLLWCCSLLCLKSWLLECRRLVSLPSHMNDMRMHNGAVSEVLIKTG